MITHHIGVEFGGWIWFSIISFPSKLCCDESRSECGYAHELSFLSLFHARFIEI